LSGFSSCRYTARIVAGPGEFARFLLAPLAARIVAGLHQLPGSSSRRSRRASSPG
jgi:hypothetical protein